jgi:hypothetical protein
VIAPLYVLVYLLAITVAPIVALATTFDVVYATLAGWRAARR